MRAWVTSGADSTASGPFTPTVVNLVAGSAASLALPFAAAASSLAATSASPRRDGAIEFHAPRGGNAAGEVRPPYVPWGDRVPEEEGRVLLDEVLWWAAAATPPLPVSADAG